MDESLYPPNMTKLWMNKISKILLIAGGLNWGTVGLFNLNLVEKLSQLVKWSLLTTIIYVLVFGAALYFLMDRNFYLSFLGETVYPCGSLVEKIPEKADMSVSVKVPPNSNVIYWASEPNKEDVVINDPWEAYGTYQNAGVVKADDKGIAILKFRHPSSYKVFRQMKTLQKHVHYRYCFHPGMLSEVLTVNV